MWKVIFAGKRLGIRKKSWCIVKTTKWGGTSEILVDWTAPGIYLFARLSYSYKQKIHGQDSQRMMHNNQVNREPGLLGALHESECFVSKADYRGAVNVVPNTTGVHRKPVEKNARRNACQMDIFRQDARLHKRPSGVFFFAAC